MGWSSRVEASHFKATHKMRGRVQQMLCLGKLSTYFMSGKRVMQVKCGRAHASGVNTPTLPVHNNNAPIKKAKRLIVCRVLIK